MRNKKIKKNIELVKNKIKGFTLVETLVAVFILTFTMLALMTVVADSLFAARYARYETTAIYLAQEASDFIRNDRDNYFIGEEESAWDDFLAEYSNCFYENEDDNSGCYFEVLDLLKGEVDGINICDDEDTGTNIKCPFFYFDDGEDEGSFYTYEEEEDKKSNFQRKISMKEGPSSGPLDEVILTVTVSWRETDSQVYKETILETTLTKWQ